MRREDQILVEILADFVNGRNMRCLPDVSLEAQVPYAFFKGCELRDLYPTPELRTMGDVDVLVRDEDMARTAAVLRELGYRKEEGGSAVWVLKKDRFSYEVHRRLAFGTYWNKVDYEGYFASAFPRLVPGEGSRRFFSPEDHFVFLCFHLAKHLNSSGAGIRRPHRRIRGRWKS